MRKYIPAFLLALSISGSSLMAQNITIPADSVQILLCKKWEVDYVLMGDMKIGRMPGAPDINYEFYQDKTFLMSSNNKKEKKKGTWSYDPKKRLIKLTVNGKSNTSVVSLAQGEMIMLADTKEATPDDPMELKIVYKTGTK